MRPHVALLLNQTSSNLRVEVHITNIYPPHTTRNLLQRQQSHFHPVHQEQKLRQLWSLSHLQQQWPLLQFLVRHPFMYAPEQRNLLTSQVPYMQDCSLPFFDNITKSLRQQVPDV
ncbi:hypothetical protein KP509_30G010000 [Ceratopteris richardii]|uniref:Uncharacterized protein n=1 Tax=Ceratopteris richardii TaxID=49495 RepID=A0A8T2QZN9_CERRI|nr:hypothetical protein KP509_30G010000 [Ceratopteris richardii]